MVNETESAQGIPIRIRKADPSLPLPSSYSTTPHGTIFSTTPGGTRVIYDRNTLLNLRLSPLSRTPPTNLGYVPGITKGLSSSYNGNGHSATPLNHTPLQNSIMSSSHELDGFKSSVDEIKGDKLKRETGEMFHMDLE